MAKKKTIQCPKCGETSSEMVEEIEFKHAEKISKILKSNKTPHEKKMALFNWLKDLDVGELQAEQKQRINSLLLSKLYAELAKQSMKEYKKITAKSFGKFNN
jgi:hypothetical protein